VTQSRSIALADLLAKAKKLETYRADGTRYCKKCDNLVVCIQNVLENLNVKDLNDEDMKTISAIKEVIIIEEAFAQSSADLRDPQTWFGSPNE
jgi:hypothetical protein